MPPAKAEVHSRHATKTPGRICRDGESMGAHAYVEVLIKERKLIERTPYLKEGEQGELLKRQYQNMYEYMNLVAGYNHGRSKERFGNKDATNLKKNMQRPVKINGVTYSKGTCNGICVNLQNSG